VLIRQCGLEGGRLKRNKRTEGKATLRITDQRKLHLNWQVTGPKAEFRSSFACGMSRVYSCMEDVACRTRTVTTVCSHISRKRHPSSLPYLLWMTGVHRLYQVAHVLAALWTFLLLWLRKLLCVMLGRSQKSLRKVCAFVIVCLFMASYACEYQCTYVCPNPNSTC